MIQVENLMKRFGTKVAVDDVSFAVRKGEVLGFLGPNGAGKSTTMRIITGFLNADRGRVTIGDHAMDEHPIEAKALIGYLPENAPSYGEMTVDGFLQFCASLRGISASERRKQVDEVIDTCFLEPVRYQTIDTLSKGYRHRTCFAQAILHDPDVLILDEPTDGLDPNQKHEVRSLIKRMSERKAIILSTHILEEVDAVCSRVIVINNGKIVANGLPDELKARSASAGNVSLRIADRSFSEIRDELQKVQGVTKVIKSAEGDDSCAVICEVKSAKDGQGLAQRISEACHKRGWIILELASERGRLDEVFREITTGDGR